MPKKTMNGIEFDVPASNITAGTFKKIANVPPGSKLVEVRDGEHIVREDAEMLGNEDIQNYTYVNQFTAGAKNSKRINTVTRRLRKVMAFGIILPFVACSTTKPVISPVAYSPMPEIIMFEYPMSTDQVSGDNNPGDLVRFATKLFERGKYEQAADFYLQAAAYKSTKNELRNACLIAAAEALLLAGDRKGFIRTIDALCKSLDQYQLANLDSETELLISLADWMQGRKNRNTPSAVRELFDD